MKNVIIGILGGILISGMDWWIYEDVSDRVFMGFSMFFIVSTVMFIIDDKIDEYKMKKKRMEQFKKMVSETKNRP